MAVSDEIVQQIEQLKAQQAYITDALSAMLQGIWTGEGSVEALLLALDPSFQLQPKPPNYDGGAPTVWWNPDEPQKGQRLSWSCSACSLAWILRATGANSNATEDTALGEIGTPQNVNSAVGLCDGSGPALQAVYNRYGLPTKQGWLSFDQVWALAGRTTGQLSGVGWYHWVALRGRDGPNLRIANSAPSYKGVGDILTREDFNRLGPFSVVWIDR